MVYENPRLEQALIVISRAGGSAGTVVSTGVSLLLDVAGRGEPLPQAHSATQRSPAKPERDRIT